ncbi:MAG: DsrE family protein [Gammaproteobacteria bacterium]|nr:DsrE family protein [Gammaproteobacteria bacterium]
MKLYLCIALLAFHTSINAAEFVQTPYTEQKVVFDFYLDDPAKTNAALFWVRSLLNPLMEEPYGYAPDFMEIKVVIHGTEIVTLAKNNYEKYKTVVERMKYYSQLGVEFRVCALAAEDYGYAHSDFHDFVQVVPSAITELAHWQLKGHALIRPIVMNKIYTVEEIR